MSDGAHDHDKIIESLLNADAYPTSFDGPVERISTHISDVLLAGEFAYKIKKPVNFGFVDFTTPELRRELSEREVELNGRLSEGVYLSVEPVLFDESTDRYSVRGDGETVDWAVKMRRLDADDQLDRLLERDEAGEDEIRESARVLAGFHRNAPTAPTEFGTVDAVSGIVLGNLARVAEHAPPEQDTAAFANVSAYASAFLQKRGSLITARPAADRPRMCHGDLHAGNIFIEKQADGTRTLQIIDCIEFNDSFVYIDPAADLAFLSMDLKRRGHPELAAELIKTYIAESGDDCILPLLPFYESYRAMVRCMAASISAEQADDADRQQHVEDASAYLQLASEVARNDLPQFLAVTAGLTGTGKSTVAKHIATQWNAVHINSDTIRRELAGIAATGRSGSNLQGGIYTPEMSRRTYEEMHRQAKAALGEGKSVVMDGTHLKIEHRRQSLDAAREAESLTLVVFCELSETDALQRLETRYSGGESESEGRPEVYEMQLPQWERPAHGEADIVAHIDTGVAQDELPSQVFTKLWDAELAD